MIEITTAEIDSQRVTESVRDHRAGAVVLFLGTVREFTGEVQTASLEYEAYQEMAEASLQELIDEAKQRWPLIHSTIVHRIGPLQLGDIAVAVAVSTAHRHAAFESGQWLMDTIKQRVPIWKKEIYASGETQWVHPGLDSPAHPAGPTSSKG